MSNHTAIWAAALIFCAAALTMSMAVHESPAPLEQSAARRAVPARRHVAHGERVLDAPASPQPPVRPREPRVRSADITSRLISSLSTDGLAQDVEAAMWDAVAKLAIGEDEMLALLDQHCGIEPRDIPDGSGAMEYTARVARLGARGVMTESGFYDDDFEARFPEGIQFAIATDESNAPESPAREFSPATGAIFATFASETVESRNVLVKWIDVDRNAIHVYGKYVIDPGAAHSYVWLEPSHGWPEGTYAVEIYAMNGGLEPLAGGRYVVRPTRR